jgi:hypothetical protein
MLERKYIEESLAKAVCYKCGCSLKGSDFVPITEAPIATVAHVVCANCQATSMVTITPAGTGAVPLVSDFIGTEIKKFSKLESISYDEVLELHQVLKDKQIWKLLQKKEKYLGKRQKNLEEIEKSQQ